MDTERPDARVPDTSGRLTVRPRRPSTDAALLHLVRVVLDEAWSPHVAAHRLVELVGGDLGVLQRARARVLRAATERATETTERAIVTLDFALRSERTLCLERPRRAGLPTRGRV
jgi:hypothetical protein